MSTGLESWTPVKEVAALSPFGGSEFVLTIIAVALWIVFHIWQIFLGHPCLTVLKASVLTDPH